MDSNRKERNRNILDRLEIRRARYGSLPWRAYDPVSADYIALPPDESETVTLNGVTIRCISDSNLWPRCFPRKRDVVSGIARARAMNDALPDSES